MAIQTNRPNNRIFIIVGVILALAAAGGVFLLARGSGSGSTTQVVVATQTIPAGTPVTSSQLTTQQVDTSIVPQDVFINTADVVGRQFVNTVSPNTIIAHSLVVTASSVTTSTSDGLPVITPGFVALAIPAAPIAQPAANAGPFTIDQTTGDQVAVGFYIAGGDHIDILVDNGNGVHYTFQDVRVLKAGGGAAAPGTAVPFYIVELPRDQAEIMTYMVTHQLQSGQTSNGFPQIVKYVLRPTKEYGDPTSKDPSKSYPHYESSCPTAPAPVPYPGFTCQSLPAVTDNTVNLSTLTNLFGH